MMTFSLCISLFLQNIRVQVYENFLTSFTGEKKIKRIVIDQNLLFHHLHPNFFWKTLIIVTKSKVNSFRETVYPHPFMTSKFLYCKSVKTFMPESRLLTEMPTKTQHPSKARIIIRLSVVLFHTTRLKDTHSGKGGWEKDLSASPLMSVLTNRIGCSSSLFELSGDIVDVSENLQTPAPKCGLSCNSWIKTNYACKKHDQLWITDLLSLAKYLRFLKNFSHYL